MALMIKDADALTDARAGTCAATLQRVRLRYLVGEFKLFSFWFPARVEPCFLSGGAGASTAGTVGACTPADGAEAIVRLSEPSPEDLPRFALLPGSIRYVPSTYARYFVDLKGGLAQYLAKFSSKSRNTLLRKTRKFAESAGGEVTWRRFQTPAEMAEFHATARLISARTYQEQLLDAGLPDTPEFLRDMAEAARAGLVRGYLLYHGETPAAYAYCKASGPSLTYELLGHDPAFQHLSPGSVLLYHILQDLFEQESFEYFDFGGGEAGYKAFFCTGSVRCADVYYFRKTVTNAAMLLLHDALARFSDGVVRILVAARIKDRIKKLLRSKCPKF